MSRSEYREHLTREVGNGPKLCVGMQNPSTADDEKNDATISRLIGFTRRLGFGSLSVVNWSTRRATQQKDLYEFLDSLPDGVREAHLKWAIDVAIYEATRADLFIAAWGNGRAGDAWPMDFKLALEKAGIVLHAFGFTQSGAPKHPIARGVHRIPDDQKPIRWSA